MIQEAHNAIEVNDLHRTYHTGKLAVQALRGVNFQIESSSFVAVKGRSGSGKTTLLNCIGGLDQPTQGSVLVHSQNIFEMRERARTRWRREQVGFVFQSFGLLPTLSAYENVELILRMSGVGFKNSRQSALDAFEKVGLAKWVNHRPRCMPRKVDSAIPVARRRNPIA